LTLDPSIATPRARVAGNRSQGSGIRMHATSNPTQASVPQPHTGMTMPVTTSDALHTQSGAKCHAKPSAFSPQLAAEPGRLLNA